jgi:hypothetical protein
VADDRDPSGNPFRQFKYLMEQEIKVFWSRSIFNCQPFRSKVLTITDNFTINSGINKITIGTHNGSHNQEMCFLATILEDIDLIR